MSISPRVSAAGLVGLAVLTTVLVGVALRSNDSTPASPTANASVSPSATTSATASATAAPTTTPANTTAQAAPLQTMLVAVDDKQAWRVNVGSCAKGGGKVAITVDGGRTWTDAKSPMRTIVRVRPKDALTAFVVGADSTCTAELKDTANAGATWASVNNVGSAWFRDPKDPVTVRAPGSATSAPCGQQPVLDLAAISIGSARVLCADGLVRSTTDTGSSWTDSGKVSGAVALAVSSAAPTQTYVALLDPAGCAGVQVRPVAKSEPAACIKTAAPKDPGQIALSLVAGGGWLSVGDTTMRSTDNLLTWSPA